MASILHQRKQNQDGGKHGDILSRETHFGDERKGRSNIRAPVSGNWSRVQIVAAFIVTFFLGIGFSSVTHRDFSKNRRPRFLGNSWSVERREQRKDEVLDNYSRESRMLKAKDGDDHGDEQGDNHGDEHWDEHGDDHGNGNEEGNGDYNGTRYESLILQSGSKPGWERVSEIPIEFLESSCVWISEEFWCVGGYKNGEVASYSPQSDTWTLRARMAIKVEHIFNTAISLDDGKTLAVIGGVGFPPKGVNNNKPFKVRIQLLDTLDPEAEWRVGDSETDSSELDIGGITTCTVVPVRGEYFCTFGSDYNFIRIDTMRFFAFNPKTMRFRQLPEPPVMYSHVSLLADLVRDRVIYLASRIVRKKLQTDEPSRTTYFYDVVKEEWNLDPPTQIPEYMPSLEGRTCFQDPSTLYGYLIGGQNNAGSWVSEIIYKFTLSENPSDRELRFEPWSRQPGHAKFGSSVREVPPGSGKLIMVGGGLAVGPFPVNEVWFWDHRKDENLDSVYHLQRKVTGDTRPQPKHYVLSATFGNYDVTSKIQQFLDDGWTHFNSRTFPDFDLLDDWQWLGRKGVKDVTKLSNGLQYRTGWPIWPLAITLLEDHGHVRIIICPKGGGCKISFWEEAEEEEQFKQLQHFPQWELPRGGSTIQ